MWPINVTVSWDALPPTDAVMFYTVFVDGIQVGQATGTSLVTSIAHAGTYAFGVSATNQWGENTPTVVSVKITPPGQVANVKVVKT